MDSCIKHPHEIGINFCGRCGGSWCADCLVYPFGEKKPPLCMTCAMVAAGVRTAAERPALPRKELKRLSKEAKARQKARRGDAPAEAPAEAPVAEPVSAITEEPANDWSSSWWEREPTLTD